MADEEGHASSREWDLSADWLDLNSISWFSLGLLEEIDAAVYRITTSFLGSYSDLLELVDVRRPSEIEGVGSLNEPNIMKAELHERVVNVLYDDISSEREIYF
ncbi:hypothetical protein FOXG_04815 [Fusarium oxysporum f. sp. lycopersici 4287]|uniref:Uncharacterized protein n=2 Tax=Fusarium oxysporum TaxID=5507 RepID=A0A0J9UQL2_FUSO4|nr:hypothetical protein FOXG_04815 [Fusarium oxysporum f. sp. lycopersici 4287]KNB01610.1 hypothetical protein FOXG_04815 [Fusarium oxysporum f. sp. lycopersici 4287]